MKVRTQLASFFVIALGVSIAIAAVVWRGGPTLPTTPRHSSSARARRRARWPP